MTREAGTLHVWITFTSDWHVGTGVGVPGGVDRVVARDDRGAPIVPATTLAGVVRDAAEDVAVGLGDGDPAATRAWEARLLRLFGGLTGGGDAPEASLLHFHEATVVPEILDDDTIDPSALVGLRFATRIDPETGTAARHTLRVIEVGRAGTVLHATIDHPDLDDADELLLLAALRCVGGIGAKRRRGLGRCRVHLADTDAAAGFAALWERTADAVPPAPQSPMRPSGTPSTDSAGTAPEDRGVQHLEVVLEVLEPVAAQDRRLANELTTLDFIPGSLLLPALDASLDRRLGPSVATGTARVGDATPAWEGPHGPVACLPAPRCLFAPKEGQHGRDFTNRLHTDDPGDSTQMKGLRGGWVAHTADRSLAPLSVMTSGVAHAVIDDDLQRPTAESGGLFVRHAIDAGQVFVAPVVVPDHLADALEALAGSTVRLGRATSRGQGRCRIADVRAVADPTSERSKATGGDEVVVLAGADVLVRSATGRLVPDATSFAAALGGTLVPAPDAQTAAFVAARRRESWHAGWGLPRPSLVGLAAGSVVRIRVDDPELFAAGLANGVGERTAEGFGRVVRVPFLEHHDVITCDDDTAASPAQPGGPPSSNSATTPETPSDAMDPTLLPLLQTSLYEATQLLGFDTTARAAAAELATRLQLSSLSRTQLGQLRQRARQAAAQRSLDPVAALVDQVAANANRRKNWELVLPPLQQWLGEQSDADEVTVTKAAIALGVAGRQAQLAAARQQQEEAAQR